MGTKDVQWDIIARSIKDERCIPIIGTEIFSEKKGVTLAESLIEFLKKEKNFEKFKYYPTDGLFHFPNKSDKTIFQYHLEDYYNAEHPQADAVLKKLAEIPFPLFISLNVDQRLVEIFKEKGVNAQFDFYWRKRLPEDQDMVPSVTSPAVYNLFGSVSTVESLIITHEDLFGFVEGLIQTNPIPENLRKSFQNATSFLFIGAPLNKWYIQLLLRILSFHNESPGLKYAYNLDLTENDASFCSEQFNIEIINSGIQGFVDELYNVCESKELIGKRDSDIKGQKSKILLVKELIGKAEVNKAFEAFNELLEGIENREAENQLVQLSARQNTLERDELNGVISYEEKSRLGNSISAALLQLLDSLESLK